MIVYFNGRFLPKEEVRVSPDDRGFLFADGAYEVIRAYRGRLFRVQGHLQRLERSLRELRIVGLKVEDLRAVAEQMIERNNLRDGDASLYIQVTRGVAPRRHAFPEEPTLPTIYLTASPYRPSPAKWDHGVSIILVPDIRWSRCDIKALTLLPNVLASQEAKEKGAEEAIFVREGVITEGAHTNFCAVIDGRLVTHPTNHHILAGITRQVVLELCDELHIPYRESPIAKEVLPHASEAMILGTTTEIMPVVQVEDWQVRDGLPGPITRRLQQAFRALSLSNSWRGTA
jgi:D-alanine transaminase